MQLISNKKKEKFIGFVKWLIGYKEPEVTTLQEFPNVRSRTAEIEECHYQLSIHHQAEPENYLHNISKSVLEQLVQSGAIQFRFEEENYLYNKHRAEEIGDRLPNKDYIVTLKLFPFKSCEL